MDLEKVKSEAAGLSPGDQRRLAAYLVSLRHQHSSDHQEKLAKKIDDDDNSQWIDFDEFDRRVSTP